MTIKVYTKKSQPFDRLFTAYTAKPETPRGEYDGEIKLAVTNITGYAYRGDLRVVAERELRKQKGRKSGWTVRRIARTG